jgi:hypothetical protein
MVTTIHAVTNILRQNAVSRDRMDLAEENMVILEENGRVVVTRKNRVTRILVVSKWGASRILGIEVMSFLCF